MRIALCEIDIFWEDKIKNKINCNLLIEKAVKKKADLILFPEMTLTGFSMNTCKTAEDNSETFLWFQEKAIQYKTSIGFGWTSKCTGKPKNNYSVVTCDTNNCITYSKIHLFSPGNENTYFQPGNSIYEIKINEFNVCPFICYDLRFPEIFQAASKNCNLITVAANWPKERKDHWLTLLKARAIENQCFVAGVNRKGIGQNIFYSGDSCIFNPLGEKVSCISFPLNSSTLFIADIDLNAVVKTQSEFNIKKDRNPNLYSTFIHPSIF